MNIVKLLHCINPEVAALKFWSIAGESWN